MNETFEHFSTSCSNDDRLSETMMSTRFSKQGTKMWSNMMQHKCISNQWKREKLKDMSFCQRLYFEVCMCVCRCVCVRVKVTEVKVCEHEHVSHMWATCAHVLLRTHQRFSMWYSVARTHKHSCAGSCFCATKVIQLALSLIEDYLTIHLHFCCVFVSGPKCISTVTPDWRQQMFQIL